MPFKVIQGHQFRYKWKARLRLPINNSNLRPILHRFRDMADYWSIFAIELESHSLGGEPLNSKLEI